MKSTLSQGRWLAVAATFTVSCDNEPHSHSEHHHGSGDSSAAIHFTIKAKSPLLIPGQKAEVEITLADADGHPITLEDLTVIHTEPIHLLLIDETLSDYHHEHPVATETPGKYLFSFTPHKPGSYRIWADLVLSATGKQEYRFTDIGTNAGGIPDHTATTGSSVVVDGLNYLLSFDQSPIKKSETAIATLEILNSAGNSFNNLEPVMGAFAHVVAFYDDRETLAHVHPMGAEPDSDSDRGNGILQFHLKPEKPGLIRIFIQTQIGGHQKFAPFAVQVID